MVLVEGALDGRHQRRVANRAAVLDALVGLWRDGHYDARATEIAERAGLSSRSLFRYFDDLDDLVRAAVEHVLTLVGDDGVLDARPSDATAFKVRALLGGRDRLFGVAGVAAHAARLAQHRSTIVTDRIAATRRWAREQVADLFAPELATASEGTLDLVDLLTSFETWELRQGMDHATRRSTESLLATTLTDLLTREGR